MHFIKQLTSILKSTVKPILITWAFYHNQLYLINNRFYTLVTSKVKPNYETQVVTCTWMIGKKNNNKTILVAVETMVFVDGMGNDDNGSGSPPPSLSLNYAGRMSLSLSRGLALAYLVISKFTWGASVFCLWFNRRLAEMLIWQVCKFYGLN